MKEKTKDKNKFKLRRTLTSSKKKDPLLNDIFFGKFKTVKKLGEGSFGKVYKAEYKGEYYAVKFESRSRAKSLLEQEATIMAYLQGPNIPYIVSSGYSGDYNLLVMQLMDKSLEDILRIRKTFSIKTTCMVGFQLIGVLHFIHDKNIIHRDVKPDNCVMGSAELNENLYLIDFGLAKKYRSSRTLKQYPQTRKKRLTGTARYASIHALEGYEQSRRDDMESVGYIMAYLLRGGLPWQGLKLKSKENKYKNILEKKKEISSQELFKGFPNEFSEILDYTKNLGYEQEPEYQMLRNKLMDLCKRLNDSFDYIYDWTTDRDLAKRKNKKNLTSMKTQSTLSTNNARKNSKSKKKEKFVEKVPDGALEKHKKNKDKDKEKSKKQKTKKEETEKNEKEENDDNNNEDKNDMNNINVNNEEEKDEDSKTNKEEIKDKENIENESKEDEKKEEENKDNIIKEDEHENDDNNSNGKEQEKEHSNICNEDKNSEQKDKISDNEEKEKEKEKEIEKEKGEEEDEDKKSNNEINNEIEAEKENSKSKTDSFENNEQNKEENKSNNSNGAENGEEEPEVNDDSACCKM